MLAHFTLTFTPDSRHSSFSPLSLNIISISFKSTYSDEFSLPARLRIEMFGRIGDPMKKDGSEEI